MKECKDCIHYDVCGYHITEETDMSVEECAHEFKDKARFAEIVRCKECIYASAIKDSLCDCNFYRDMRNTTDFCNYGERRKA